MQVLFVSPACDRQEALQLAQHAKALSVRPHVLARWARFLVANGQSKLFPELHGGEQQHGGGADRVQLSTGMLDWCDRHAPDAVVVPPEALLNAAHTNSNAQARACMNVFNRGREGYASTRAGHADDPDGGDASETLAAWELPEDNEEDGQAAGERAGGTLQQVAVPTKLSH